MKIARLTGASAVVLLLLFVPLYTAVGTGTQGMHEVVVISDIVNPPSNAIYTGPMDSGELNITIGLSFSNAALLNSTIASLYNPASPSYHKFLSPQQFIAKFSPQAQQLSLIEAYMTSKGLKLEHVSSNRMLMTFTGSALSIDTALGVRLETYMIDGRPFYDASGVPRLPASIGVGIAGIEGLQDFVTASHPLADPHSVYGSNYVPPTGPDATPPYNPATIHEAYNFTSIYSDNINGGGVSEAIVTAYGFSNATVQAFDSTFGISGVRIVVIQPAGAVNQIGLETTLDTEWLGAISPNSTIYVIEGPNAQLSTFTDLFTYVVDHNISSVMSTSWGTPESETPTSVMNNDNNIFKQAAAEGISVTVASGDNGAYDRTNSPTPDFPASSPYVTAVGGTWLNLTQSGRNVVRSSETAWNMSGGGISSYFNEPAYQKIPNAYNLGGRGVPDVAMSAYPESGYFVYFNGSWDEAGGTSFGAPIWAGILSLENQLRAMHGEGNIGLANLELYAIANSSYYEQAFYQITEGYNGYYYASPGYNLVTGLGTPDAYNLIKLMAKIPITPLKVSVSATPPWGDAPLDVSLYANVTGGFSPYSLQWYMNGVYEGNSTELQKTLTQGNYEFRVVVTDNASSTVTGYENVTVLNFAAPNNMTMTASPSTGDANLSVSFTATPASTVLLSNYFVYWAFGDGPGMNTTSFSESTVYRHGGNFTAVSTAFVSDSSAPRGYYSMQANDSIHVYPRLQAIIISKRFAGSYPLHLHLIAGETGGKAPYTYTWNYQNSTGNFTSSASSIYVNYTVPGSYMLSLSAEDYFGSVSQETKLIKIYDPISVQISVSPSSSGVAPFNVTLRANVTGGAGGYLYSWNIAGTVLRGNPVYYVFTNGGTQNVELKVTDVAGDVAYANTTVHVQPLGFISLLKGEIALVLLVVAIAVAAVISYVISRRK